jgi:hypothetical protein
VARAIINKDNSSQRPPESPQSRRALCVSAPGERFSRRKFVMNVDLVREGVSWFELAGSVAAVHALEVE